MASVENIKRKKGVRNEENYKQTKIKKAKLMGNEHIGKQSFTLRLEILEINRQRGQFRVHR